MTQSFEFLKHKVKELHQYIELIRSRIHAKRSLGVIVNSQLHKHCLSLCWAVIINENKLGKFDAAHQLKTVYLDEEPISRLDTSSIVLRLFLNSYFNEGNCIVCYEATYVALS